MRPMNVTLVLNKPHKFACLCVRADLFCSKFVFFASYRSELGLLFLNLRIGLVITNRDGPIGGQAPRPKEKKKKKKIGPP